MEKNRSELVKHSSGINKEFTIFDALLECLIKKEKKEHRFHSLLKHITSPFDPTALSLMILGWVTLGCVGHIIWTDITFYGKDLVTILFSSRVGENISLGIDMRLIYYLLIGLTMLLTSLKTPSSRGQERNLPAYIWQL